MALASQTKGKTLVSFFPVALEQSPAEGHLLRL